MEMLQETELEKVRRKKDKFSIIPYFKTAD